MKKIREPGPFELVLILLVLMNGPVHAQRWMEDINRATVAVQLGGDSVYIGWRMLGTDPEGIGFNIYRISGEGKANKLNNSPLTSTTDYIDVVSRSGEILKYFVKSADKGMKNEVPDTALVWSRNYLSIPLQTPEGYSPGDASCGGP